MRVSAPSVKEVIDCRHSDARVADDACRQDGAVRRQHLNLASAGVRVVQRRQQIVQHVQSRQIFGRDVAVFLDRFLDSSGHVFVSATEFFRKPDARGTRARFGSRPPRFAHPGNRGYRAASVALEEGRARPPTD